MPPNERGKRPHEIVARDEDSLKARARRDEAEDCLHERLAALRSTSPIRLDHSVRRSARAGWGTIAERWGTVAKRRNAGETHGGSQANQRDKSSNFPYGAATKFRRVEFMKNGW